MAASAQPREGSVLLGALGIGMFLLAWEIIGQNRWLGLTWPALSEVVAFLLTPSRQTLFLRALTASLGSLAVGYCLGLVTGIAAAMLAHTVSPMRASLDTMSAFIHAIPSIALAPLFIIFLGRESTPAALAALSTFFVMYVTTTSSFASSRPEWIDLMRVLGASRLTRLRMLDIPAAIPIIVGGMRLAAPSALIGVIIGEWFGASRGVGVLIINAMQNFQIPLLWSAVVLAVIVSLSLFALLGLLQEYAERRFR
jgi:ABC-type nitrate/sulfonate/bicarbonate transport system permease component